MQWLKQDGEDRYFVDYLMRYAAYTGERLVGSVVLTSPAARISHFISQRLAQHEDSVLQKAEWFQAYWNSSVESRGILPKIVTGERPEKPEDGPTIIFRRLVAPVIAAR
jgi:hypothetical protein